MANLNKTTFTNTLCDLWEIVQNNSVQNNPPLKNDDEFTDSCCIFVKKNLSFWDSLAKLSNSNPKEVGTLLGVDADIVKTWYGKLKQISDKINQHNRNAENSYVIPTGTGISK